MKYNISKRLKHQREIPRTQCSDASSEDGYWGQSLTNTCHHSTGLGIKMLFIDRLSSCCTSFSPSGSQNTSTSSTSGSPTPKPRFQSLSWLSSPADTHSPQLGYKIDADAPEEILQNPHSDSKAMPLNPKNTSSAFVDFVIKACCF